MNVDGILKSKGNAVTTVLPDTPVSTVVYILKKERIGALVVSDDDKRMLGIMSERDIINGLAEHGERLLDMRVSELISEHVWTCKLDDQVDELMQKMTYKRIRHLPAVEDGKLCGIVSIGDVVKNRLEEMQQETNVLRDAYIIKSSRPC